MSVIKLPPFTYMHVLDKNTNVTTLFVGPQRFTCFENHQVIGKGVENMIMIPPKHYCIIENPIQRDKNSQPIFDSHGQVLLKHGEKLICFASENNEPFPLYPGEILATKIQPLRTVLAGQALKIEAINDFWVKDPSDNSENSVQPIFRRTGDQWLFEGPGLYIPSLNEEIIETLSEYILKEGQALKLTATRDCVDRKYKKERPTGSQWLMKEKGAYIPGPYEKVEGIQNAIELTEKKALRLRCIQDHVDIFEKPREKGDEWLVTYDDCKNYLLDVNQELVSRVDLICLTSRQSIVIENPVDENGRSQIGKKIIVRGPRNFFCKPPYEVAGPIHEVVVLEDHNALELNATESFYDEAAKKARHPGEHWLVKGPGEYWPVLEAKVVRRRVAILPTPLGAIYEPGYALLAILVLAIAIYLYLWK